MVWWGKRKTERERRVCVLTFISSVVSVSVVIKEYHSSFCLNSKNSTYLYQILLFIGSITFILTPLSVCWLASWSVDWSIGWLVWAEHLVLGPSVCPLLFFVLLFNITPCRAPLYGCSELSVYSLR